MSPVAHICSVHGLTTDPRCCTTTQRPDRAGSAFYRTHRWRKISLWIRRQDGACNDCGNDQDLSVHHADGDWTNNTRANLVTLCATCHGKRDGGR